MFPQLKSSVAINAVSTTAAATTTGTIDTIGFDWATIDVVATTQAASTLAGGPSTLKLQEADVTAATTLLFRLSSIVDPFYRSQFGCGIQHAHRGLCHC